jgi:hypothetical protein
MDSARKQDAIIAETARGTTPATPTFLLLPAMSIGGRVNRPQTRARSRQPHRSAVNMVQGLTEYARTIDMDLMYEASLHELFSSLFQADWATNVLKFGSTLQPISMEEKFDGTTTYRRSTGLMVDSLRISSRLGGPIQLSFGLKGIGEATASAAIAGATYTAIGGKKPFTPANIVVTDAFSITTPKVQSLDITFANNSQDLYGFGTNDPDDTSLGELDITGSIALRFTALAQYSTFVNGAEGVLDLTLGHTTAEKYQLKLPSCTAFNPDIVDPGATGPHTVNIEFTAKYSSSDATAAILTRAVA